jgi:hypothetical protein
MTILTLQSTDLRILVFTKSQTGSSPLTQPNQTQTDKERRESHRIRYPIPERPSLFLLEKKAYAILDVSSRGLRYAAFGAFTPSLYEPIKGVLHFRRGPRVNIEGTVVRANDQEVALYLHKEIPFNILLAQQQYLRKHYPMWL